jgi:hypothetical protein
MDHHEGRLMSRRRYTPQNRLEIMESAPEWKGYPLEAFHGKEVLVLGGAVDLAALTLVVV